VRCSLLRLGMAGTGGMSVHRCSSGSLSQKSNISRESTGWGALRLEQNSELSRFSPIEPRDHRRLYTLLADTLVALEQRGKYTPVSRFDTTIATLMRPGAGRRPNSLLKDLNWVAVNWVAD
jgi:hypothetical protein